MVLYNQGKRAQEGLIYEKQVYIKHEALTEIEICLSLWCCVSLMVRYNCLVNFVC